MLKYTIVFVLVFAIGATLASASVEQDFLFLLNAERSAHDLTPLVMNVQLTDAALKHSADMAQQKYFSHTSKDGRSFVDRIKESGYSSYSALGENIAYHSGSSDAAKVFTMWKNSAGHYQNMMSSKFMEAGLGVYSLNGLTYYTLDLGARRTSSPPSLPGPTPVPPKEPPVVIPPVVPPVVVPPANDTTKPEIKEVRLSFDKRRLLVNMSIVDENFKQLNYIDANAKSSQERRLCSRLKNGSCTVKILFSVGEHGVTFVARDKAGNVNNDTYIKFSCDKTNCVMN